jgi:hypothetical protein
MHEIFTLTCKARCIISIDDKPGGEKKKKKKKKERKKQPERYSLPLFARVSSVATIASPLRVPGLPSARRRG